MCRIEQFDVVYPNGDRDPREQLVPCHRGTRSQPCRGAQLFRIRDRFASDSERPPTPPRIIPIEPRHLGNSRRPSSSRERKRDPITGVTLNFKFWNPFSSKKKEKENVQYYVVRGKERPRPHPPVMQPYPPIPPPPPEPFVPPVNPEPPIVVPIQPPRGRRRRQAPIIIQHSSEEDEDESSSPPEAIRQHERRTRSLSSIRRYEAEKERIRQREFRERERREIIRREEREARDRAALLERLERQRTRDDEERERVASIERRERREREERRERQRERNERREREERQQDRLRERLAAEQEAIRQRGIDRERARIQQEREDHEHRRAARRAQQRREDIARRLWEQEDFERERAAEERARYRYEEQRRRERAWEANIPLHPRHPVFVHHNDSDRGDRVIRDDIRAENLRQFERRAERLRGRYDDGWLRRRNTVDGGRRWHDGYWRDRR